MPRIATPARIPIFLFTVRFSCSCVPTQATPVPVSRSIVGRGQTEIAPHPPDRERWVVTVSSSAVKANRRGGRHANPALDRGPAANAGRCPEDDYDYDQ